MSGIERQQAATCSLAEWSKRSKLCVRACVIIWLFFCGGVTRFIPRTLSRNIRIEQALCRRECPAEGWTDGLWCTERKRGEQKEKKEKKKKSVGLLRTVSRLCSCLVLAPVVSRSASLLFHAEGEMLRGVSDSCPRLCPSHHGCRMERGCCSSPGLLVHVCAARAPLARALTCRTQPAGARGFDPSVIDARARRYGCLSPRRAHTYAPARYPSSYLSLSHT